MTELTKRELVSWCAIQAPELENHPGLKVPLRICRDSSEMASLMADELFEEILTRSQQGVPTRAILPCGPTGWHKPFAEKVNATKLSLAGVLVFLMDECLDWQGRLLPANNPFNFAQTMNDDFFARLSPDLTIPQGNRHFLRGDNLQEYLEAIEAAPIDIAIGGWGQDGHVAFNQARRNPFSPLTVEELRASSVRVQENNSDTIIALAQRTLGCAYQLVPPMSVTVGMKEILSARKVRVYSDTGAWKQTALRVTLFGPVTPEYPMTLLQVHPDALITSTLETASHPISLHPEWDLGV